MGGVFPLYLIIFNLRKGKKVQLLPFLNYFFNLCKPPYSYLVEHRAVSRVTENEAALKTDHINL